MQNLSKKKNKSRAFQARGLCLEQGSAKYGTNAKGNDLLGILAQRASRPSLLYARWHDWLGHTVSVMSRSYATALPGLGALPRTGFRKIRC